jgi:hypothetical protein
MKRWMLGALVICVAACGPKPNPTGPGSGPAQLCQQVPLTGNAVLGVTLVHAAAFSMLMIENCSFDMGKVIDAARECRDHASCGQPIGPSGLTVVNESIKTTWTTVSLGGGRAFQAKVGDRTMVAWDNSRDPLEVLTAVSQPGASAVPGSCCPGCSPCDAGAGTPACPAGGGEPPKVDVLPAAGFPDLPGPAVCSCARVCLAHANKTLPADCDCERLCRCP